jgi:hypothetical protein
MAGVAASFSSFQPRSTRRSCDDEDDENQLRSETERESELRSSRGDDAFASMKTQENNIIIIIFPCEAMELGVSSLERV